MSRLSRPRIPSPRILFCLLATLLVTITCIDDERNVSATGTVTYIPIEGGFHGIVADNGEHWDPDNLPPEFAIDSVRVAFEGVESDHMTYHQWGRTVRLSRVIRIGDPPRVNLEPFRKLARASDCGDVRNRLVLIDNRFVFWDRESHCADAAYDRVLYYRTVEHVVCRLSDSIAGPLRGCSNADPYGPMFDTILKNLDAPDLGLGPRHTVTPVDF
jgi:hypothetical protein